MSKSKLIPSVWQIPDYFHSRLGDRAGRQRAMVHDGHLLLVLHEASRRTDRARQARLFYRQPDGSWHSTEDGGGQVALEKHLQQFEKLIDDIDNREDHAKTADDYFALLEDVLPIKRTLFNLHTTLDEARKHLPAARELIDIRDQAYDIARSADLLHQTIESGSRLALTRRAEEQARHGRSLAASAYRLNLLVAFFFPLATLAAVFGMNLRTGLEEIESVAPLMVVCLMGLVLGGLLIALIIQRPQS